MKRFTIYLLVIMVILSISGCWNKNELDELAIVQGLGLDQTQDKQIKISLQILKPGELKSATGGSGGGSGNQGVWIATSEGETLFDAIRNATVKTERKLFFSHNKVVVIGEDLAREGVKAVLDFLDRDAEPRLDASCFIARGKAEDILKATHEQEDIPAEAILGLAKGYKATSMYPEDTKLLDLLITLKTETKEPILAGLLTYPSENEANKVLIKLTDTAVFKGDKLVEWFTPKQTRGILWVLGDVASGIVVLQPSEKEEEKISIEIIQASSKITPQMTDDRLSILVKVNVKGNVGEETYPYDLLKPEAIEELNQVLEAAVIEEIESALSKAQKLGVDVFGFGEEVHNKFPKVWPEVRENWIDEFKNLEVTIQVKADIVGVGRTLDT